MVTGNRPESTQILNLHVALSNEKTRQATEYDPEIAFE